ncbi:hypothetical protein ACH5RR_023594 [Cinchona calisaya]|uniref:Retrovirus-related Pol polyprotein from transposon TNT 1-94-like beta-barrel domain-containing protein n=1 Tax=Cinchona calisaya TaxID=153742 RepID=A0ABD2ZEZ5_9GENT
MSSSAAFNLLECLFNHKIADSVWNRFTNRYYQYWKFRIIALSPTQNWETEESSGRHGGLLAILHSVLVNLVLAYDHDLGFRDEVWVVDSGASCHAVKNKKLLENPIPYASHHRGFFGKISRITHKGDAYLPIIDEINQTSIIRLRGVVYHAAALGSNNISVARFTQDFPYYSFEFYKHGLMVRNIDTGKVIVIGPRIRHKYYWPTPKNKARITRVNASTSIELIAVLCKLVFSYIITTLPARIADYLDNFVETMYKINAPLHDLIFGHDYEVVDHLRTCNVNNINFNNSWMVDTGATRHLTGHRTLLQNLRAVTTARNLYARDYHRRSTAITHHGQVHLKSPSHDVKFVLQDVALIPEAIRNFVAKMIDDSRCFFEFRSTGFVVKSRENDQLLAKGPQLQNAYYWPMN